MKKKYYAVRAGRDTGIFSTWEECEASIRGFKGAQFKSCGDRCSAELYLRVSKDEFQDAVIKEHKTEDASLIAYVDGSFREGAASYGCVIISGGEVVAELSGSDDRFPKIRNIYGELLGAVKAVEWGIAASCPAITIYYDYSGIEKWAVGGWKTNNILTRRYKECMDKLKESIDISFEKVAAHSGNYFNERADKLARNALPEKVEAKSR
ncbi:MAG: ribonuclease H family protein [Deferribacteraceae bacterium]|jgi:ribonuclease HI|nr:ribonuclease H family protein [Deferribacteraceae bacterium]